MTTMNPPAPSTLAVHLIVGPTGSGKTATAQALARQHNAPIVVADRIQCFTDLTVTSDRANGVAPGVSRQWLAPRTVADGDYPAAQAALDLVDRLLSLTERHRLVIVEGGSISLLRGVAAHYHRLPSPPTVQLLHIPDRQAYLGVLTRRARRMLAPEAAETGMLQELSAAWQHRTQRLFVASINGFEAVLEWCAKYRVHHDELAGRPLLPRELDGIAALIAQRHAEHGFEQERCFSRMFDSGSPQVIG